jgi:NitT/TauT family transport system substrate-binding protein
METTHMLRRTVVAAALGAASVAFAGIATPALAQTRINFATDWKAQAEHGGFYQAIASGIYARYGLDVNLRPGGPAVDNQQLLAAGALDIAMGSNTFFGLNMVQAGAPVRVVASIFQKDPQILMTHPRTDVNSLADMKGKPIMIGSSSRNTFWVWLKARYGFTDDQIRPYTFNMAPFLVDRNAIQQGYLSSEPNLVKKEGNIDAKVFLLADSGYPSYSSMIMAQQSLIDRNPKVVQDFVNATIEGWYSYLWGNPAPANALIKRDNPDMDDATIAYGIAKLKEYQIADGGDAATLGIGAMTEARWKEFFDIMVAQGIYKADLDWKKAFTFDFVNKKHAMDMKK